MDKITYFIVEKQSLFKNWTTSDRASFLEGMNHAAITFLATNDLLCSAYFTFWGEEQTNFSTTGELDILCITHWQIYKLCFQLFFEELHLGTPNYTVYHLRDMKWQLKGFFQIITAILSDIIYYRRADIHSTLHFLKLKEGSKDLNIRELLLSIMHQSNRWKFWRGG